MPAALAGCHGAGPSGDEADAVFAAAYAYVAEYSRHFFPSSAVDLCLEGPGARRIAWRMRDTYLPVRYGCVYAAPGYLESASWSRDSVPALILARGDSAAVWYDFFMGSPIRFSTSYKENGETRYREESYLAMLWRRLRATPGEVGVHVRYSDGRVEAADFSCLLYRASPGWAIEQCDVSQVKWRISERMDPQGHLTGCWQFDWAPLNEEDAADLPRLVFFSDDPDTLSWTPRHYKVALPVDSTDSKRHWRWRETGEGTIKFEAGGGFEGIRATLVLDPTMNVLRGVALDWDDVGPPLLSDPMWSTRGKRTECPHRELR
jgi:hypothetical protein